jgi:hypothetical protein
MKMHLMRPCRNHPLIMVAPPKHNIWMFGSILNPRIIPKYIPTLMKIIGSGVESASVALLTANRACNCLILIDCVEGYSKETTIDMLTFIDDPDQGVPLTPPTSAITEPNSDDEDPGALVFTGTGM